MITPKFELSQTDNEIIIHVYAPYTNIKDTEIDVNEDTVIFYSTPYYLRLNLPGHVEETDDSSARYDSDEGKYIINLSKVNRGEHFPNLDMLATLLQPKSQKKRTKPLIEVIGEDCITSNPIDEDDFTEEDWFLDQHVTMDVEMVSDQPSASSLLLNKHPYGFLLNHSGLYDKYSVELGEVAEIRNPDMVSIADRRKLRIEAETEKFSDDHYLADLMENEEAARVLQFEFDVKSLKELTEKDKETMKELGNREFLIDNKEALKRVYLGMIDILYAYCYDWRITEGKHCCESAWNIARLSATLSWFDTFDSIQEVIHSGMRRSLSYPLIRHWKVSRKAMKDVIQVLRTGFKGILICFLDIYYIFNKKKPYYLLNQLYIEEYCIWIQRSSSYSTTLHSIHTALEKSFKNYDKEKVGFDLVELEAAAKACEDEQMEQEISNSVQNVQIQ